MARGARLLLLGWIALAAPGAGAAKLFVAANGSDVAGCGLPAAPCRSIGAALARAAPNDTVEVGPGRYGDLDGDGSFDDPGDELAEVDTGCDCMIHLGLPVRLVSRDGAGATLLDAGGAPIAVVRIDADGAVLGKKRRGFSFTGSGDDDGVDSAGSGVRVEASFALANGRTGFSLGGDGGTTLGNRVIANLDQGIDHESDDGLIRGNLLLRNGDDGIEVSNDNVLLDNLAALNTLNASGIRAEGSGNVLRGNASLGNGAGFGLLEGNLLARSVAAGNANGVVLFGPGNRMQGSAVVGSLLAGVSIGPEGGAVVASSLFGNDPAGNCGVASASPLAPLLGGSFWGAAAGPGADPADAFCELVMAEIPVFEPLATQEIRVRSKAAQLFSKLGKLPGSPPPAPPRVFVAANGVDGPGCGSAASPCRSIGAGLAQAVAGDTIEVGPGRYGDLDGDGTFGDPGEEAAEIDAGCDCLIHVTLPVTVVSRDGAGATLIDAADAPIAAVSIGAAGATFGAAKRGFTVTRSGDDAGVRAQADGVRIEGNLSTGNGAAGILVVGGAPVILGNQLIDNSGLGVQVEGPGGVVRGNVTIRNAEGMDLSGGGVVVEDNLALGNQSSGFEIEDGGARLRRNAALGNALDGFTLSDDCVLEGNVAAGNVRGVTLFGLGNTLRGNAIVGNEGVGVFVADGAGGEIVGNSVFGNHAGADPSLSPGLNCGVALDVATPPLLGGNFWGAASGPGADPADAFCPLVALAEPAVLEPVAAAEVRVRPKAAQ